MQTNIFTSFRKFFKKGEFVDLIIKTPSGKLIKTHRIIIASYSKSYFAKIFASEKVDQKTKILQIDIPYDEKNSFVSIVNSFYTGKLQITENSATTLLNVATYYGFTSVVESIIKYITPKTEDIVYTIFLTKSLSKAGNSVYAIPFVENIANCLFECSINGVSSSITKEDILDAVSYDPLFLARILTAFNNEHSFNKLDQFEFLDKYVSVYIGDRILTNEEKTALTNAVMIKNKIGVDTIVKYKCEWLPDDIAGKLLSQLIDNRRITLHNFEADVSNKRDDELIFNWVQQSWFSSVSNGIVNKETPQVNVIKYINSVCGSNKLINLTKLDLVRNDLDSRCIGKIVSPDFNVEKIFESGDNFLMLRSPVNGKLGFSFFFSNSIKVKASKIKIDCSWPKCNRHIINKPCYINIYNGNKSLEIESKIDSQGLVEFDLEDVIDGFEFVVCNLPAYGCLRVNNFELIGQFL